MAEEEGTSNGNHPILEVVCRSSGKVRRFAVGTDAGFALSLINRKLDVGSPLALHIESVKEGEEPISFGPSSLIVDYGNGWQLQTVTDELQGFRKGEAVWPTGTSSDGSRPVKRASLQTTTDWSKLPDDLLKLVARRLHSIEDFVRFGGVCRSWHQVFLQKDCSSYSNLPWLMLRGEENSHMCVFYSPFRDKVYEIHLPEICGRRCWGSGHGWLVTVGTGMDMHILNPLSRVQIPLPPFQSCPNLNKLICTPKEFRDIFVCRAYLSSNPSSPDCVVIVTHSDREKLAFTKPGDKAWTPLECSPGPFDDIIYFNGNFFVLNALQNVLICKSTGSHIKTICTAPLQPVDELRYEDDYLVEFGGEIYLIMRHLYDIALFDTPHLKTYGFSAYKLDMYTEKWEVVKSLVNWSFFLGNNYPFSVSGSDYSECRKNCIYFTDDYFGMYGTPRNFDMGIFNFEDYEIEPFARGHNSCFVFSPPLWIRPSLW